MRFRRTTAALLSLLYLSVAAVFGVVHHHHGENPLTSHDDCAACVWAVGAVTDVPIYTPLVAVSVVATTPEFFENLPVSSASYTFSPSRAPPVTPA